VKNLLRYQKEKEREKDLWLILRSMLAFFFGVFNYLFYTTALSYNESAKYPQIIFSYFSFALIDIILISFSEYAQNLLKIQIDNILRFQKNGNID
jgi:hypothetical protein